MRASSVGALLVIMGGCGTEPSFDASRFGGPIDNEFSPLTPGNTTIYRRDNERWEVSVTADTQVIMGVTCVVVHQRAFVDDVLREESDAWFAQDRDGAVWSFGGAEPELVMPARPMIGDSIRGADVVKVDAAVHVLYGGFNGCVQTENASEIRFYCPGVGEALSVEGDRRRELAGFGTTWDPIIDPSRFTTTIDNRFLPLVPGTRRTYVEVKPSSTERVEFSVTRETKVVMGVTCVVVHDQAFIDDVLEEDTYDWFAQDDEGTVWYFGEATRALDGTGQLTDTTGSWEAGVDGARPGIIMPADPKIGDAYREEFYAGSAEDEAEVVGVNESVQVPYGSFDGCVQTKNFTRIDPAVIENKFYCPDVGEALVLEEGTRGELVAITAE